ncbi:hypothetical protein ACLQ2Q_17890 [Microbacterium sp. DT81.1]
MTTREGESGVLPLTGHRLWTTGEPPEVAVTDSRTAQQADRGG